MRRVLLGLLVAALLACGQPRASDGGTQDGNSTSPTEPAPIENLEGFTCQSLLAALEGLQFGGLGQRSVRDAALRLDAAGEQWSETDPKLGNETLELAAWLREFSPTKERIERLRSYAREWFPHCLTTGPGADDGEPPPEPKPEEATFGDGTWVVGKDIKPGTYRNPDPSSGCYWERLRNFSGGGRAIIANGLDTGGPIVVQILGTDEGFNSQDCGEWTTDLSRVSPSKTRIGDGIWIVGVDVAPGTYRTTKFGDCYWERVRAFTGSGNSIIANGLPTGGSAIVEIRSTDAGFTSLDCGTWTKV